jgi:hypothetical protein
MTLLADMGCPVECVCAKGGKSPCLASFAFDLKGVKKFNGRNGGGGPVIVNGDYDTYIL